MALPNICAGKSDWLKIADSYANIPVQFKHKFSILKQCRKCKVMVIFTEV